LMRGDGDKVAAVTAAAYVDSRDNKQRCKYGRRSRPTERRGS